MINKFKQEGKRAIGPSSPLGLYLGKYPNSIILVTKGNYCVLYAKCQDLRSYGYGGKKFHKFRIYQIFDLISGQILKPFAFTHLKHWLDCMPNSLWLMHSQKSLYESITYLRLFLEKNPKSILKFIKGSCCVLYTNFQDLRS